jgi:exodeoxyribonuclease V alpha subunit
MSDLLTRLGPVPSAFCGALSRRSGCQDTDVLLAAALACWAPGAGHVCADLAAVGPHLPERDDDQADELPEVNGWVAALQGWPQLVRAPGDDRRTPLVLDGTRLYTERSWHAQAQIARVLAAKCTEATGLTDKQIRLLTTRIWKTERTDGRDAVEAALRGRLTVISGGPGTGKTTLVARLLALLRCVATSEGRGLRILLMAPTGKAAERLAESVRGQLTDPEWVPLALQGAFDLRASTMHSGLGSLGPGRGFRHGPDNPLDADIVVLDEGSMVTSQMMATLLVALPAGCQLVLMGDPHQLQAVGSGAVLADLVESKGPIAARCVRLTTSHRYAKGSTIPKLDAAVRGGEAGQALALLGSSPDVRRVPAGRGTDPLGALLRERVVEQWKAVLAAADPKAALKAQRQLGMLCATKRTALGVAGVNQAVESWLQAAKLIPPGQTWYEGRPVMVLSNDRTVGLQNGNLGLVRDGKVWFDHDNPRSYAYGVLPEHTTCFAMTIHKSQGSEFDEVVVVLPRTANRILTRSLLYTGITRAKREVTVVGS